MEKSRARPLLENSRGTFTHDINELNFVGGVNFLVVILDLITPTEKQSSMNFFTTPKQTVCI